MLLVAEQTDTPKSKTVRLSVNIPEADYVRLVAYKARHRAETGETLTTQELVSRLIRQKLDEVSRS